MKSRIMVIDDEENYAYLLKIRLESAGNYEVMALCEVKDLINHIHAFRPEIILLDLLMPGIGGLDVCDMLNNDSVGATIPIIVISGLDKNTDKLKAFKFGVSDYFVKPVDNNKLIAAIEKELKFKAEQP